MSDQDNQNIIPFSDVVNAVDEAVDKSEKLSESDDILPLPTQLVNYRNKNYFAALMLIGVGVVFSVFVHDFKPILLFLLFSSYFIWRGIVVEREYRSGRIAELVATCTGIKPSFYKDRIAVTFAAEAEEEDNFTYYKFVVPNKKLQDDFIVGAPYVIYFDRNSEHVLMGYVQVGASIV